MKNNNNRREFLKTLLAGGSAGALGSLGQLALMSEVSAAAPAFSDYKAMVCVFLYGGNDSFNMLVPTGSDNQSGYAAYAGSRGDLAISNQAYSAVNGQLSTGSGNPYYRNGVASEAYRSGYYPMAANNTGMELGVNAVMPELAQLISNNKASVVANIGNLVQPVTRSQILTETANLPKFLFAHNHQQRALQTGQGDDLNSSGWAGRIADQWTDINSGSPMGLNVSYTGSNRMLIGDSAVPLVVNPGKPPQVYDMKKGLYATHSDRRALFQAMHGQGGSSQGGYSDFSPESTYASSNPFERLFSTNSKKSMNVFDLLNDAWGSHTINYTSSDSYGNSLFSVPDKETLGFETEIQGELITQLEAVAKMIDMGVKDNFASGGYNRQIFLVSLGGFDTHSDQSSKHPIVLRELSLALSKFQTAMEDLGHENKVSTFTLSDFGRSLGNNGDGTDHGWGANHLVMGGDGLNQSGNLLGGQMHGQLPDFRLEGTNDYNYKGLIIPSIAQEQLNASLCQWFGVDAGLMQTVFPNLTNFSQTSDIESAYLNNIFAS